MESGAQSSDSTSFYLLQTFIPQSSSSSNASPISSLAPITKSLLSEASFSVSDDDNMWGKVIRTTRMSGFT